MLHYLSRRTINLRPLLGWRPDTPPTICSVFGVHLLLFRLANVLSSTTMSSVSYVLPDGTPCDRQGNPLSTRGSSSRSISSYSRGTTSYNLGDQAPQSWPPRADPSRVSERATRGYNPSYYGEIASRAGSKPPTSDRGYTVVEPGPPKGTLMSMGYEKYKGYDEEAYANKEVYTDQRNAIPRVPKGRRTEPYYGDPAMSSTSHGQLLQQAANTANAARM